MKSGARALKKTKIPQQSRRSLILRHIRASMKEGRSSFHCPGKLTCQANNPFADAPIIQYQPIINLNVVAHLPAQ